MGKSTEGYLWTPSGVVKGLNTDAVVPSTSKAASTYDVVVIGSGFAGIVAARDLSQVHGFSVLLVEGRDRIGGRTWTATAFGEQFEMGGTWVSPCSHQIAMSHETILLGALEPTTFVQ